MYRRCLTGDTREFTVHLVTHSERVEKRFMADQIVSSINYHLILVTTRNTARIVFDFVGYFVSRFLKLLSSLKKKDLIV